MPSPPPCLVILQVLLTVFIVISGVSPPPPPPLLHAPYSICFLGDHSHVLPELVQESLNTTLPPSACSSESPWNHQNCLVPTQGQIWHLVQVNSSGAGITSEAQPSSLAKLWPTSPGSSRALPDSLFHQRATPNVPDCVLPGVLVPTTSARVFLRSFPFSSRVTSSTPPTTP